MAFPTFRRVVFAFLWLPVAIGCGGVEDVEPDPDAGAPGPDAAAPIDAGPSYEEADWLFEPDRLLRVDIVMAVEDWDFVRLQTRNIIELFGPTCALAPSYSPFEYRPATVTVEGDTYEMVGVRKKGFLGSLNPVKPSLKIKFHEYVPNQTLSGMKRMTLNNDVQDPSYLDQCLGYQVFERAGIPAPRCNFAVVTLNGEPLGVYTHVESIKKQYLGRHFADTGGNMYEGTLSDFRDGWMATFERKTNESVPPGTEDRSDIEAIKAAADIADDAAFVAELDTLIDLDEFYTFWAVETLLSHWDGYAGNDNNFYIYDDPTTGKFVFMPWGIDQLFGDGLGGDAGLTRSVLTRRLWLYPPTRAAFLQRFTEVLDTAWDDADMLAEVDRMGEMIAADVPLDQRADWNAAITELRNALNGREAYFRGRIAAASAGDADALSSPLCFDDSGDLTGSFTTVYGGGGSPTASMQITIDGTNVPLSNFGAFAGPDDQAPGKSNLFLAADVDATHTAIMFVSMPDDTAAPGVIEVGKANVDAALLFFVEGQQDAEAVYWMSGTLNLTSGAASPGATWQGTLDLDLWNPPWL